MFPEKSCSHIIFDNLPLWWKRSNHASWKNGDVPIIFHGENSCSNHFHHVPTIVPSKESKSHDQRYQRRFYPSDHRSSPTFFCHSQNMDYDGLYVYTVQIYLYVYVYYIIYIYILCIYNYYYIYIYYVYIYILCTIIYIYRYNMLILYNHDRLHRICTFSTLRVWTEKKQT